MALSWSVQRAALEQPLLFWTHNWLASIMIKRIKKLHGKQFSGQNFCKADALGVRVRPLWCVTCLYRPGSSIPQFIPTTRLDRATRGEHVSSIWWQILVCFYPSPGNTWRPPGAGWASTERNWCQWNLPQKRKSSSTRPRAIKAAFTKRLIKTPLSDARALMGHMVSLLYTRYYLFHFLVELLSVAVYSQH